MADFKLAFDKMLLDEGGLKLHTVPGDRGGMTYGGISRRFNPEWPGWKIVDRGDEPPIRLVFEFYRSAYWAPLRCDEIVSQRVASSIFNFAVNTSAPYKPTVAVKLAQTVVGATPDGVVGPRTVAALNTYDPDLFVAQYAIAKLARYLAIVRRDRTQAKFLEGWLGRVVSNV